jgi:hypothetical protein
MQLEPSADGSFLALVIALRVRNPTREAGPKGWRCYACFGMKRPSTCCQRVRGPVAQPDRATVS